MSVNSEMTAIADLIRGLRGVSGKMGLDAMKGHLQDEQDGLDSALAALTEKGVTVPAGTKVDGLADLIAAIEVGGESFDPSPFTQILIGSYTPASNEVAFTIPTEAVGKVAFLLMFNNVNSLKFSHAAQLCYNNFGWRYDGEAVLYKYAISNVGGSSTTYPSISTDGRTFTTVKSWMFAGGVTFTYVLGMVNE